MRSDPPDGPPALEASLQGCRPGLLLRCVQGDLAVYECCSSWTDPHRPALAGHLVVVALTSVQMTLATDATGPMAAVKQALSTGAVCVIPAGVAVYLDFAAPHHMLLLCVRPRLLYGDGACGGRPAELPPTLRLAVAQADPVLHAIALALRAIGREAGPVADHLGRAFVARLLLRHACGRRPQRPALGDLRLQRALAFLQAQLAEPVTLADAAQAAGCSVHHFAHLFKSTLGLSPMRYLLKLRMERALELVQTTQLSMTEIGCRVGLPESARFSRTFRAYWKSPPSALRRQP